MLTTSLVNNVILLLVIPLATLVVSLANMEGEESFDASLLGTADSVTQERVCDDELIVIRGYVIWVCDKPVRY